ncbi:MAG: hypothetical protein AAF840_00140 [Bacteroidota bacterium]
MAAKDKPINSFLKLYEEDNEKFVQEYELGVRRTVKERVRTVHLISDIIELFFPRLADTATLMIGGDVIDPDDPYLTIDEKDSLPPSGSTPPLGPEGDEEVIR